MKYPTTSSCWRNLSKMIFQALFFLFSICSAFWTVQTLLEIIFSLNYFWSSSFRVNYGLCADSAQLYVQYEYMYPMLVTLILSTNLANIFEFFDRIHELMILWITLNCTCSVSTNSVYDITFSCSTFWLFYFLKSVIIYNYMRYSLG